MKIGILTFNFVPNSGAVLQCWALQQALIEMGHEVYVIDYRPEYHLKKYIPYINPITESNRSISKFLKIIYYNRNYFTRKKRLEEYERFTKVINCTSVVNEKNSFFSIDIASFDAIICGSDQIWNKNITNNSFDAVYFADINGFEGKKVSYAASLGDTNIKENSKELYKFLKDFSSISVREKNDAISIEESLEIKVHTVPDPTFLMPAETYKSLMKPIKLPSKYILVYGFGKDELFNNAISMAAEKYDCDVISISPYKIHINSPYTWIKDVDPSRFLSYILNADFIVTNSFHCTAFSIFFHKDFCVVRHTSRNSRIENLLENVNLTKCMVQNLDNIKFALENTIDYEQVDKRIAEQRQIGKAFLVNALAMGNIIDA